MAALVGKELGEDEMKKLAEKEGPGIAAAAAASHSNPPTPPPNQHTSPQDNAANQPTQSSAPAQLSGSGNELTTEQREEAVEQFVTQMTDKFVNVIVPGLSNLPANLAIQYQFAEFVRAELNNAENKEKLRNTLSNSISDVLKNTGENGSALLLLSILKNASLNEPNQIKNGLFPKLFNLVEVDNTNFSENFTTAISQFLNNSDKIKSFVEGSTSITVLPGGGFFDGGKRRHTKKKSRKLLQKSIILRKKSRKMNKKKGRKVAKTRKIRSKKMVGGNPNAAALFSELPMADVEPPIKTLQDINNDHITATENINSAKAAELQKITDAQSEAKSKLSDTHIDEQATLAVKHKAEDDALTKKYTFGKDMFGNPRTQADLTKERAAFDLKQENEKKAINLKHILEKSNQSSAHENQKNIAATAIQKQYASNHAANDLDFEKQKSVVSKQNAEQEHLDKITKLNDEFEKKHSNPQTDQAKYDAAFARKQNDAAIAAHRIETDNKKTQIDTNIKEKEKALASAETARIGRFTQFGQNVQTGVGNFTRKFRSENTNASSNPPSTIPANVPIEPKRNYTRKFREGLSTVGSKIGSGVSAVGSGVSAVRSGALYSANKIQDTAAYGANKLKPVTQALSKTASVGYNVLAKGASVGTNILGSGASMLHQGVKSLSNHQFTNPDPYSSNGSGSSGSSGGNSSAGSSNLCESQSQDFIREFFAHITNKQSNMSDMLVRSLINALGDVVKNNSTGLMNEITSIFGQINNNLQQQMGQNAFTILILNLINSQGELFVDSIADAFNAKLAVELRAYVKTQEFSDKVYENFVKKLSKMVETTK